MRILIGVLVISALVAVSVAFTNWLDRRKARHAPSIIEERTDDGVTILAKRRAERERQRRRYDTWRDGDNMAA
jgi:Flp pilus assembly protein TadB